eukprot:gnl/MRDRNA2_/MRDRNA2_74187_c0_seq2.p1 gnl/MRDRNA2_/MRDRNA2_74187_c0~~gnl/MRDRNA2_/MRDRNA2_74187_c0_seq2.p1  ORF type:complete len:3156 (+),score=773.43 gnl/MRDRNA2_/MRDRNA2_74187_c0_seq2:357-9470(+)
MFDAWVRTARGSLAKVLLQKQRVRETQVQESMLGLWSTTNNTLCMQTSLHAWLEVAKGTRVMRQMEGHTAAMRSSQAQTMEILLRKATYVWDDLTVGLALQSWIDATRESKATALNERLTTKLDDVDQKHRTLIGKTMLRWGEHASLEELMVVWRWWVDEVADNRRLKHLIQKEDEHTIVLNHALFHWGEHNNLLLLQLTAQEWLKYAVRTHYEDARAVELEQQMRLKETHDRRMEGVLLKMDQGAGALHTQICFMVWADSIQDSKLNGDISDITAKAQHLHDLHRADVQKLLGRMAALEDSTCLAACFKAFIEEVTEAQRLKELSLAEDRVLETGKAGDRILDKAIVLMGSSHQQMALHDIFHEWHLVLQASKDALDLAVREGEEARIREIRDGRMRSVIGKMASEHEKAFYSILMKAWRDVLQDEHTSESLSESMKQAERFRRMHQEDVRKLMFRLVSVEDSGTYHVVLSCWMEVIAEKKKTAQLVDAEEKLNKAQKKHDNTLTHALQRWDSTDQNLMLHNTIHAWRHEIVEAQKEEAQAIKLAEQEEAEEIYNTKMKFVLERMAENHSALQARILFEGWRDFLQDRQTDDKLSGVTREAERLRRMHQSDVRKVMAQMLEAQASLVMKMALGCWRELEHEVRIVKTIETRQAHIKDCHVRFDHTLGHALVHWGETDKALVLHCALHDWRHVVKKSVEKATADMFETEQSRLKQKHDVITEGALLALGQHAEDTQMLVIMKGWSDVCKEMRHRSIVADEATRAQLYRELHRADVHRLLFRLAAQYDSEILSACLYSFWELVKESRAESELESAGARLRSRHGNAVDKAMHYCCSTDNDYLLHTMINSWYTLTLMEHGMETHALHDAEKEALQGSHQEKLHGLMVLLETERNGGVQEFLFHAWADVVEDQKVVEDLESTTCSVQRICRVLQIQLRRYIQSEDEVTLLACFNVWWREVTDTRCGSEVAGFRALLDKVKNRHGNSLDNAIQLCDSTTQNVLLQALLHSWWKIKKNSADEKDLDDQALLLAEHEAAKEKLESQMRSSLMLWAQDQQRVQNLVVIHAWRDYVANRKAALAAGDVAARAERFREMHRADVRKLLFRLATAEDGASLKVCFGCWKEAHQEHCIELEIQSHVDRRKVDVEKHENVLEKALLCLDDSSKDFLMHSLVFSWHKYVVGEHQMEAEAEHLAEQKRLKEIHDDKVKQVLLKAGDKDDHLRVWIFFDSWQDHVHHGKTSELEERANRFRDMHRSDVRKLLFSLSTEKDSAALHAVLMCWREIRSDAQKIQQMSEHQDQLRSNEAKAEVLVENALVALGDKDKDVVTHVVLRTWSHYVVRKREMEVRTAALAEHQRLKEVHDETLARTLYKLEDERGTAHLQLVLNRWLSITQDAHQSGLGAEAQRLKELHRADVRKLLFQLADRDDTSMMVVMMHCWLEVYKDAVQLRAITEKEAVTLGCIDELTTKHDLLMDKALLCWGSHSNHSVLNAALRAWHDIVNLEREMDTRAAQLAEEKHFREVHDDKMKFVLYRMEGAQVALKIQIALESWKDLVEDMKLSKQMGDVAGRAERIKEMHRADVRKLLYRLSTEEESANIHACVGAWREVVKERIEDERLSHHLAEVHEDHHIVLDKAIACWGETDKNMVMHSMLRIWHEEVVKERETDIQAGLIAEKLRIQEVHDTRMKGVLLKMEDERSAGKTLILLRSWHEYVDQTRGVAGMSALSAEAYKLKQMHNDDVRRLLARLASSEDETLGHMAFGIWHEEVKDKKQLTELTEHLDQKAQVQSDYDRVVATTLERWGEHDAHLMLHMVMDEWWQLIKKEAQRDEEAARLAELERIKEVHDAKTRFVLLKMDDEKGALHAMAAWQCWHDLIEDKKLSQSMSDVQRRAEYLRELHRGDVRKLLVRLADGSDRAVVGACFGAWKEAVHEQQGMARMQNHLENTHQQHEFVLDAALMRWGEGDDVLLQHTMLHVWIGYVMDQREMLARATQLAEQERIRDIHDKKMEYILLQMDDERGHVSIEILFGVWHDYIEQKKLAASMGNVSAEAERLREMHRADVRRLLFSLASEENSAAVQVCISCWHEVITDVQKMHELSEMEAHLEAVHSNHDHIMDGAILVLGDHQDTIVEHTVLRAWLACVEESHMQAAQNERIALAKRLRDAHATHIESIIMRMGDEQSATAIHVLIQAWRDTVQIPRKDEGLRDAIERVERTRAMHKANVERLLGRLALQDSDTAKHVCFAEWHKFTKQAIREHEVSLLQGHLESVMMKHTVMANGALFALGKIDSALFYAYWFHQWSDRTRTSSADLRAKHMQEAAMLAKELDEERLQKTLYRWESEQTEVKVHLILQAWIQVACGDRRSEQLARLENRTQWLEEMHQMSVHRLVLQMAEECDRGAVHVFLAAWNDLARKAAHDAEINRRLAATQDEHERVLDKALARWGDSDGQVILRTVLHALKVQTAIEMGARLRAEHHAERKTLREAHDTKMGHTLSFWESDSSSFKVYTALQAWKMHADARKRELILMETDSESQRLRLMHDVHIHKLIEQFSTDRTFWMVHVTFVLWSGCVAEEKQIHYRNVVEGNMVDVKIQHESVMDKTLVRWAKSDEALIMKAVLHRLHQEVMQSQNFYAKAMSRSELEMLRERYLQKISKAALRWSDGKVQVNLSILLQEWLELVREKNSEEARLLAERRLLMAKERGDLIAEGALVHLSAGDQRLLLHWVLHAFSVEVRDSQASIMHLTHAEEMERLRQQRGALVDRVVHKGEYLRTLLVSVVAWRNSTDKVRFGAQIANMEEKMAHLGIKREALLEGLAQHFGLRQGTLTKTAMMHSWHNQALKETILAAARAEHLEAELRLREEQELQLKAERAAKEEMEAKLRKEIDVIRGREKEAVELELALVRERELVDEREAERQGISMERNIRLQEELARTRKQLDDSEKLRGDIERQLAGSALALEVEVEDGRRDTESASAVSDILMTQIQQQASHIDELQREVEMLQSKMRSKEMELREQKQAILGGKEADWGGDLGDLVLMTMAAQ